MISMLYPVTRHGSNTMKVLNEGHMMMDSTHIDDIVDGIVTLIDLPPQPET
jgi:nucleoside-diphosphate-sugar epimerase